jgi:hypothetical protein
MKKNSIKINIYVLLCLLNFLNCDKIIKPSFLWPNGEIPLYVGFLSGEEQKKVIASVTTWEFKINFVAKIMHKPLNPIIFYFVNKPSIDAVTIYSSNTEAKIALSNGKGYRKGKKKYIILYKKLFNTPYFLLHELGHVIGFTHEHQRPDRDLYISVHWNEIYKSSGLIGIKQFIYKKPIGYNYKKYFYDRRSIMHYHEVEDGIKALDGRGQKIGGDTVSFIDALKVIDMYDNINQMINL